MTKMTKTPGWRDDLTPDLPALSDLAARYRDGISINQIARENGLGPRALSQALKSVGVAMRSHAEAVGLATARRRHRQFTADDIKVVNGWLNGEITLAGVREFLGASRGVKLPAPNSAYVWLAQGARELRRTELNQ
jgi:hypothetical protein